MHRYFAKVKVDRERLRLSGKAPRWVLWKERFTRSPGVMFLFGIACLIGFGKFIVSTILWFCYIAVAWVGVVWLARLWKRRAYSKIYYDSLPILKAARKSIEDEIDGKLLIPPLDSVNFHANPVQTTTGTQLCISYPIKMEGEKGMGRVEIVSYSKASEELQIRDVYLEYLTAEPSPEGQLQLKTKKISYYTNPQVATVIDGDTLESKKEEVTVDGIKEADFREVKSDEKDETTKKKN